MLFSHVVSRSNVKVLSSLYTKIHTISMLFFFSFSFFPGHFYIMLMVNCVVWGGSIYVMLNHTKHRICIKFSISSKQEKYAFMIDFIFLRRFTLNGVWVIKSRPKDMVVKKRPRCMYSGCMCASIICLAGCVELCWLKWKYK